MCFKTIATSDDYPSSENFEPPMAFLVWETQKNGFTGFVRGGLNEWDGGCLCTIWHWPNNKISPNSMEIQGKGWRSCVMRFGWRSLTTKHSEQTNSLLSHLNHVSPKPRSGAPAWIGHAEWVTACTGSGHLITSGTSGTALAAPSRPSVPFASLPSHPKKLQLQHPAGSWHHPVSYWISHCAS